MSDVKSSISQATTDEEMGEFWDTHSVTEFSDQTHEVHIEFAKRRRRSVFLSEAFAEQLEPFAKRKELTLNQLVNLWLREKLAESESPAVAVTK